MPRFYIRISAFSHLELVMRSLEKEWEQENVVFAETLMQEGSSTTINLILHTTICIRILLMNQIQYVSFSTFDFYEKCEYSSCSSSRNIFKYDCEYIQFYVF